MFKPSRVLSTEYEDKRCPPGGAFLLSLLVWFLGNRIILRILHSESDIPLIPSPDNVAMIIIGAAALLLVQALVIKAFFRKKIANFDLGLTAQYLSYPISCALLVHGLVRLLSVHFPDATRIAAESLCYVEYYYDSANREICGGFANYIMNETGTFYQHASKISFTVVMIVYPWALFNVVRTYFKASWSQTVGLMLIAVVASFAVYFAGWGIADRTDKQVKKLATKKETSQVQGTTPPNETEHPN
ncbi:MAG: hypothetical protein ACFFDT_24255 [Candidatus Hodarchaeota archaeon]